MSISEILYSILIQPLQLFFEVVFVLANRQLSHPGFAIIALSLVMNFLVLPLYRRADAIQEEERDIEAKLTRGVAHIKKVFKGDEKMMMLRTYYRQNNYLPTDAIKGSLSLFLEIPFFIAAYQFLSHLKLIKGVAFGPVADLGAPDALLTVAGVSINVLPIIMTAVNLISSAIFVQGYPLKTKIQLYSMALFFLVFLYSSPAGLVFYWTLNNLFSLVKTIFYKIENPRKVLAVLLSLCGVAAAVYGIFFYHGLVRNKIYMVLFGIVAQLWLLWKTGKIKTRKITSEPSIPDAKVFWMSAIFLTVLIGLLIPSSVIKASPQEFVNVQHFFHPLWYVVSAGCLATGTFLVWMRVFYWISDKRGKVIFERILLCLCGAAVVDYIFFGTDYGILSYLLKYDRPINITSKLKMINTLVLIFIAGIIYRGIKRYRNKVLGILLTVILAAGSMSAFNVYEVWSDIKILEKRIEGGNAAGRDEKIIQLSKSGKNVVVIMLDRGMGPYIPYLFNENKNLREQFSGFTYYPNTTSFGGFTNFGTPALFGGYEYTPMEMNSRKDEKLVSKQNEALKVMPVLFSQNGYEVTVCDPSYANYQWVPDLSIYSDYPGIRTYNLDGKYSDSLVDEVASNKRNFFFYSLMRSSPQLIQGTVYDNGQYNHTRYSSQKIYGPSKADGIAPSFMNTYSVLTNLRRITAIRGDVGNTFLMMTNNATHEPMMLQEPEYLPAERVDNIEYDAQNKSRFNVDGKNMKMKNEQHYIHYESNMAVLNALGKWFDYLKKNGVYDNTRIIIVSDHGRQMGQFDELIVKKKGKTYDIEGFAALLMVKDYDAQEFNVSNEFMTNGDVPSLAVAKLIDEPMNPFTGKIISNAEKTAHAQYIITSNKWNTDKNNGTQFLPSDWLTVHDDIWNKDNWEFAAEDAVLTGSE